MPAWHAVPQAEMAMRSMASSCSSVRPVSSTTSPPSSRSPMVSRSASGCSWISLSMNVS